MEVQVSKLVDNEECSKDLKTGRLEYPIRFLDGGELIQYNHVVYRIDTGYTYEYNYYEPRRLSPNGKYYILTDSSARHLQGDVYSVDLDVLVGRFRIRGIPKNMVFIDNDTILVIHEQSIILWRWKIDTMMCFDLSITASYIFNEESRHLFSERLDIRDPKKLGIQIIDLVKLEKTIIKTPEKLSNLSPSSNGEILFCTIDEKICGFLHIVEKRLVRTDILGSFYQKYVSTDYTHSMSHKFTHDNKYFAIVIKPNNEAKFGNIFIYDTNTGMLHKHLDTEMKTLHLTISNDNKHIIAVHELGYLGYWNIETGILDKKLKLQVR